MKNLLDQLNAAASEVKNQIKDIDNAIVAAQIERNSLTSAPVSKSDFMDYMRADIQHKSGQFTASLARHIARISAQGFGTLEAVCGTDAGIGIPYANGFTPGGMISHDATYFYFEDLIMKGLEKVASGIEFNPDAVLVVDRKRLIAELDTRIDSLNQERNQLAEKLLSAGVQK
jgi:hypothetical protein